MQVLYFIFSKYEDRRKQNFNNFEWKQYLIIRTFDEINQLVCHYTIKDVLLSWQIKKAINFQLSIFFILKNRKTKHYALNQNIKKKSKYLLKFVLYVSYPSEKILMWIKSLLESVFSFDFYSQGQHFFSTSCDKIQVIAENVKL